MLQRGASGSNDQACKVEAAPSNASAVGLEIEAVVGRAREVQPVCENVLGVARRGCVTLLMVCSRV